jgi:hypothetical protein
VSALCAWEELREVIALEADVAQEELTAEDAVKAKEALTAFST